MKKLILILVVTFMGLSLTQNSISLSLAGGNDTLNPFEITAVYKSLQDYWKKNLSIPTVTTAVCPQPPGPITPPEGAPPPQEYCPPPPKLEPESNTLETPKGVIFIAIAPLPSDIIEKSRDQAINFPPGSFKGKTVAFTDQILLNLNGMPAKSRKNLNASGLEVYAVKDGKKPGELIFYLTRK
jgi:hypothetical protein